MATGPEAIAEALKGIDLDTLADEQRRTIKEGKKSSRSKAVRILNIVEGMKRNKMHPGQLVMNRVPVIPPKFRPFSVLGDTFVPGDSNEMYRDLVELRNLYRENEREFGREGASEAYMDMVQAVRSTYGYAESPNPKTRQRKVKGFLQQVVGTNPKNSWLQSKMLAKPLDTVGRGVIIPDADLGMDETGIPEEMAWKLFSPYIQRRLIRGGMSPPQALRAMKDRKPEAQKALHSEIEDRPIVVTRAPSWHRTNVVGQKARIVQGDAIRINPYITEGQNADFDGDTMSVHVPATPEAVKDVKEKIMASRMMWSVRDREKTMGNPKHEQIIGMELRNAPGGQKRKFSSEDEAMTAIETGLVDPNDEIEIG